MRPDGYCVLWETERDVRNMEKNTLFREKSIERVSSPEQLDRYVRAGSRGYIVLLAAIIVLLAGVLFWAFIGKLETRTETACIVSGGKIVCCVDEIINEDINADAKLLVNGEKIGNLEKKGPVLAGHSGLDPILIDAANLKDDTWCVILTGDTTLEDGSYRCELIYDSISPIKLIFD